MRLFAVGLGIAGWLCSGVQSLSPVMAQSNNNSSNPPTCTVKASASALAFVLIPSSRTSFGNMPQALQSDGNSLPSFVVSCDVKRKNSQNGSLKLSIGSTSPLNTNAQFVVTGRDGIFSTPNSTGIPFMAPGETNISGTVFYQVLVTAPNGQVLRSATTYAVTINAEVNLTN